MILSFKTVPGKDMCICMCVCVCEREREKEIKRERRGADIEQIYKKSIIVIFIE